MANQDTGKRPITVEDHKELGRKHAEQKLTAVNDALRFPVGDQFEEDLNALLSPYAVANPCYPFVSETYTAFGTQLDQIISDAAVQYIAGLIDEAGLQAAWDDWAAQGGDMITAEFNEAYHAAQ